MTEIIQYIFIFVLGFMRETLILVCIFARLHIVWCSLRFAFRLSGGGGFEEMHFLSTTAKEIK